MLRRKFPPPLSPPTVPSSAPSGHAIQAPSVGQNIGNGRKVAKRRGPFCCWAGLRRRRKSLQQQQEQQERKEVGNVDGTANVANAHQQQQFRLAPPPLTNDQFHYFGIPLRTPAEYYRFLEMPYFRRRNFEGAAVPLLLDGVVGDMDALNGAGDWHWQRQQKLRNFVVNVLGIGRSRKRQERKEAEEESKKKKKRKRKSEKEWERRRKIECRLDTLATNGGCQTTMEDDGDGTCCTCALPSTSALQCRSQQQQPLFGRLCVQLRKLPGQQLGLGIAGGSDKPMAPTISYLRPGFVAHRSDQIQVGDRLVAVNGVRCHIGLSHSQMLALLRNSGSNTVELELEYDLNGPELMPHTHNSNKNHWSHIIGGVNGIGQGITEIVLRDEDQQHQQQLDEEEGRSGRSGLFGMTLRGGAYGPDPVKSRPLTVTGIRTGGAAHREGRLRVGDRLLAVNGVSVVDSTLCAAINLIRTSPGATISLTIEYDVSILASLRKVPGPLLLEIEKVPGVEFGTELAIREVPMGRNEHRKALVVQRLLPASIADRCGAVQPGDELLAIDGISLELVNELAEVYQLLRSQSAILRLELVPEGAADCRAKMRRFITMAQQHQAMPITATTTRARSESAFGSEQRTSSRRSHEWNSAGVGTNQHDGGNSFGPPKHRSESPPPVRRQSSVSARLSVAGPGLLGSVCHTESMELALGQEQAQGWPSFGIVLARQKIPAGNGLLKANGDDNNNRGGTAEGMPLVVAQIERGSPADKCGVLQPGDRVLCINDWHTADGTLEEAQHLLRVLSTSGNRSANLMVEFNVIEPVLPPGPGSLFVVRLAKRGNCLGIVCRTQQQQQQQQRPKVPGAAAAPLTSAGGMGKGEPLIISHIRMGSVAHRCGSIQVGDRVHSIDNIPLDACTVPEAMRLLQRSAQVIKLCIAKGGGQEQDLLEPVGPQTVIYTVELARRNQPLGITIASAGGLLDPIVISQLAPGGLAERTGALHVGDRILAVNGESLEGKKVSQVTQLLHQCPDPVSIKLCRLLSSTSGQQQCVVGTRQHQQQEQWRNLELASALIIDEPPGSLGIIDECNSSNNKLGTPMKSVDSAMDSLEDSPTDGQHQLARHANVRLAPQLRPSTSNNFQQADLISGTSSDPYSVTGWDSGLSSAAATESQGAAPVGAHHHHHHQHHQSARHGNAGGADKCCECQLGNEPSCSSTSPHSSSSSSGGNAGKGADKEEWMRILEALETVGEDEMLRKLEECILNGQASNYMVNERNSSQAHLLPSECGVLTRRFIPAYGSNANANYAIQTTSPPAPALPPAFGNSQLANYAIRPSLLKRSNQTAAATTTTVRTMSPNSSQARKNNNNIPLELQQQQPEELVNNNINTADQSQQQQQQRSQPQTPVLGLKRNGTSALNSVSTELPPPMPSPRALPADISISSFLTCTASTSSTFAPSPPPPPATAALQSEQRAISTASIPFITSPIEKTITNNNEEECGNDGGGSSAGEEDKFDELSEVFSVQLVRCPLTKSFGFSVCDGPVGADAEDNDEQQQQQPKQQQRQQGIYIRSVISDGPAERSGRIQPGDRILQINGRSIQFLTCDLALPLLATERVELLLLRRRCASNHTQQQQQRRMLKL